MARPKPSPITRALATLAKKLAKTKPDKAHPVLFEAFLYYVAAGDVARATRIVEWTYGGRLPIPKQVATAHSTQALDAFCFAAGLGDRSGGQPRFPPSGDPAAPLAERARAADRMIRWSLATDRYGVPHLATGAWRALPETDPLRGIHRWRDVQAAAAPDENGDPRSDAGALPLLDELLGALEPSQRGVGYGDELVLGLDVALRAGRDDLAKRWILAHAARLHDPFHLGKLVCLSRTCEAMTKGLFRDAIGLSEAELDASFGALEAALPVASAAAAKATRPPKVQKRRVGCEHSQLHLEPDEPDAAERGEVYFEDPRESAQGLSLFRTHVGIASPSETAHCDVEVTLDPASAAVDLEGVVQAVSFPLEVRGPLRLRSVADDDEDEPLAIPAGRYDVLAAFTPKKAGKKDASVGLRVFRLCLSFRPAGSLGAPKCLRLEDGSEAPREVLSRAALAR